MSHRKAKAIRKALREFYEFKGTEFKPNERTYMRSFTSRHTAMNAVGSDRALYQLTKENEKRLRRGMEPKQPRKFK